MQDWYMECGAERTHCMQGAAETAAGLGADEEAAPEASSSREKPSGGYASLAQIRQRLTDQVSQVSCQRYLVHAISHSKWSYGWRHLGPGPMWPALRC